MPNQPEVIDVQTTTEKADPTPGGTTLALERRGQVGIQAQTNLFGDSPAAVIAKATDIATRIKDVLQQRGLISKIQGKEYPKVEAWTLAGTFVGVFPVLHWLKDIPEGSEGTSALIGYKARVEARTAAGAVIGAAESVCLRSERNWANRDEFALKSMAQTRATAKALRMPLGFIMSLAGYEATPAEEMTVDHPKPSQTSQKPPPATNRPPAPQSPQGKPASTPAQGNSAQSRPAQPVFNAETTRKWLIGKLEQNRAAATDYFRKLEKPGVLLPNEHLEDLPEEFLPHNRDQLSKFWAALKAFENGESARHAFDSAQNPVSEQEKKKRAAKAKPAAAQAKEAKKKDPDWFWSVICPVPRKGMNRDAYLKAPDTIGSLYKAMKEGDQEAQRRLWGFAKNFKVEERRSGDRVYPPTAADKLWREALDAFLEWEQKYGRDTQHTQQGELTAEGFQDTSDNDAERMEQEEAQRELAAAQEQQDVPF